MKWKGWQQRRRQKKKKRKEKKSFIMNVLSTGRFREAKWKRKLECSEKSLDFGARELRVRIPAPL